MANISIKRLFLSIGVVLLAVSCDDGNSFVEVHTDAEGLILEHDGVEVYREFEGEVLVNDLTLTSGDILELSVHFLDHDGHEIEHEDEEHGEDEDELSFTNYDDILISLELEEHCDELMSSECESSDHCQWHTDEGICEDDHGDEEHHDLGFELTALSVGSTTFTLSLMHDGHADYTSLPIGVTVIE